METSLTETGIHKERSYDGDYMKVGKTGEAIVAAWLRQRAHVASVTDLSNLPTWQDLDVDLRVLLHSGKSFLAEVKTDQHLGKSGNVLFEILRIYHTADARYCAKSGWSIRTMAEWIFYYAPSVEQLYTFKTMDLRGAFQRYTHEARQQTRQIWVNTDRIKSTLNVLIPFEEYCADICTIHNMPD